MRNFPVVDTNLLFYAPGVGEDAWTDLSSNGYAPTFTEFAGLRTPAIPANVEDGYIFGSEVTTEVAYSTFTSFNPLTTDLTVTFKFRPHNVGTTTRQLITIPNPVGNDIVVGCTSDTNYNDLFVQVPGWATPNHRVTLTDFALGSEHSIAITLDASTETIAIYENNVALTPSVFGAALAGQSGTSLVLGNSTDADRRFLGTLQFVTLNDSILSASEITAIAGYAELGEFGDPTIAARFSLLNPVASYIAQSARENSVLRGDLAIPHRSVVMAAENDVFNGDVDNTTIWMSFYTRTGAGGSDEYLAFVGDTANAYVLAKRVGSDLVVEWSLNTADSVHTETVSGVLTLNTWFVVGVSVTATRVKTSVNGTWLAPVIAGTGTQEYSTSSANVVEFGGRWSDDAVRFYGTLAYAFVSFDVIASSDGTDLDSLTRVTTPFPGQLAVTALAADQTSLVAVNPGGSIDGTFLSPYGQEYANVDFQRAYSNEFAVARFDGAAGISFALYAMFLDTTTTCTLAVVGGTAGNSRVALTRTGGTNTLEVSARPAGTDTARVVTSSVTPSIFNWLKIQVVIDFANDEIYLWVDDTLNSDLVAAWTDTSFDATGTTGCVLTFGLDAAGAVSGNQLQAPSIAFNDVLTKTVLDEILEGAVAVTDTYLVNTIYRNTGTAFVNQVLLEKLGVWYLYRGIDYSGAGLAWSAGVETVHTTIPTEPSLPSVESELDLAEVIAGAGAFYVVNDVIDHYVLRIGHAIDNYIYISIFTGALGLAVSNNGDYDTVGIPAADNDLTAGQWSRVAFKIDFTNGRIWLYNNETWQSALFSNITPGPLDASTNGVSIFLVGEEDEVYTVPFALFNNDVPLVQLEAMAESFSIETAYLTAQATDGDGGGGPDPEPEPGEGDAVNDCCPTGILTGATL